MWKNELKSTFFCMLMVLTTSTAIANENVKVFSEPFNGGHSPANPGQPLPWLPQHWDLQVHTRSAYQAPGEIQNHLAHHGSNCEAPGAQATSKHQVNAIDDTVFQCANHLMTSLRADDYGLIALTPPALVDFSNGEATIQFDISTLSVSQRDWFGIVIQPWEDQLTMPVTNWIPDLNGFGRHAIHLDFNHGVTCPVVYRNFVAAEGKDKFLGTCRWWDSWDNHVSPSAQQRQTIKITISKIRIKVEAPDLGLVWDDMPIAELGWTSGVVSLLHHSYTPHKDGNGGPNTWHWDNLSIAPATAFTIQRADQRWINQDNQILQFGQPAPENSFLRGSSIGTQLQASFDNGQNWETLRQQPSQKTDKPTWQFWHPIPAGVTKIHFRAGQHQPDWWTSAWVAKDISIFSPFVETPIPPVPESKVKCAAVTQILRLEGTQWVQLESDRIEYTATDCITEKP